MEATPLGRNMRARLRMKLQDKGVYFHAHRCIYIIMCIRTCVHRKLSRMHRVREAKLNRKNGDIPYGHMVCVCVLVFACCRCTYVCTYIHMNVHTYIHTYVHTVSHWVS